MSSRKVCVCVCSNLHYVLHRRSSAIRSISPSSYAYQPKRRIREGQGVRAPPSPTHTHPTLPHTPHTHTHVTPRRAHRQLCIPAAQDAAAWSRSPPLASCMQKRKKSSKSAQKKKVSIKNALKNKHKKIWNACYALTCGHALIKVLKYWSIEEPCKLKGHDLPKKKKARTRDTNEAIDERTSSLGTYEDRFRHIWGQV